MLQILITYDEDDRIPSMAFPEVELLKNGTRYSPFSWSVDSKEYKDFSKMIEDAQKSLDTAAGKKSTTPLLDELMEESNGDSK